MQPRCGPEPDSDAYPIRLWWCITAGGGQVQFTNNGVRRMVTTKQYDNLNRLRQISNTGGTGSTLASFAYTYNDANQRVRVTLADGSYWLYEYDRLGQVIAGRKYWSDGTPVAGQQFEYGFDDIGNRKVARRGGDENGWNLRQSLYTANLLNQYSQRTVPGYVDILGIALATKPVYVNGQIAYRKGEYFRRELSVNNASAISMATGDSDGDGDWETPL
jgi:YD repeat-containing protein